MFGHVWTCWSPLWWPKQLCVAEDTTTSYPRLLCSPWLDMKCAVSSQLTWALNKHRLWSLTWRAGACPSAASFLNISMVLACFLYCFNRDGFKMKLPNCGILWNLIWGPAFCWPWCLVSWHVLNDSSLVLTGPSHMFSPTLMDWLLPAVLSTPCSNQDARRWKRECKSPFLPRINIYKHVHSISLPRFWTFSVEPSKDALIHRP